VGGDCFFLVNNSNSLRAYKGHFPDVRTSSQDFQNTFSPKREGEKKKKTKGTLGGSKGDQKMTLWSPKMKTELSQRLCEVVCGTSDGRGVKPLNKNRGRGSKSEMRTITTTKR